MKSVVVYDSVTPYTQTFLVDRNCKHMNSNECMGIYGQDRRGQQGLTSIHGFFENVPVVGHGLFTERSTP